MNLNRVNGEMDLQLCNNYTLTDYILSDLPILGDFFSHGTIFLGWQFQCFIATEYFHLANRRGTMNKQADWNQRFCTSLLFQAEFLSKWKVWQNTDCTSKEYAFHSK